jgi:beta-galactosidase
VRMGEFAWSSMEPAPGEFRFEWLERAIDLFAKAGLEVVLGTPTAAPPAWLMQQTPDMMAMEESGLRAQFGNRCHYCVTSPEFHEAVRRLDGAMAQRFGKHPNVIGWQIDNEFCRPCYCVRCQGRFHDFLQERYGTLDNLNARWSTAYWSQTYSSWEQVPIPVGGHNPGLRLEFKHFITDAYRRFQKLQIDQLRPHLPAQAWITHNYMGWFDGFDHYELSADLDKVSWDWYIGTGHNNYLETSTPHHLTRGFKRKNFWLMETQPGNVNWSDVNNALNRGEARAMAWQAVAHGAEALLYWQWRSALGGQEQYHGTLVDASGRPRPFYDEAQHIAGEFAGVSGLLAGATIPARIAVLHDYDSRWSIQWQRHQREFDYVEHLKHYARPLVLYNLPFDVPSADIPLDGYQVVIAPALLMLDEQRVQHLRAFVEAGGHLVLTARCGMKDRYNALLPARQPGPLAELAGVEVEDYYALEAPVPVQGDGDGDRLEGQARIWAERLRLLDGSRASVLVRYGPSNGWLDGQPAVTLNAHGKGLVYYIGACLDEATQQTLTRRILDEAGQQVIETPAGVQWCSCLAASGAQVAIVINHTRAAQVVELPGAAHECLSDRNVERVLELPAYGVAVLTGLG